jgi:heat shock protein HslJ
MLRNEGYFIIAMIILIFFACAATGRNSVKSNIEGNLITPLNLDDINGVVWNLTKMLKENESIPLVKDSETTFTCNADGSVAGKATLNRYSGNLQLRDSGEMIWSKAFIMTRMAGPPELMKQESDFTQALMQTSRMYLQKSKLVMISQDRSTILEFEKTN